MNMSVTYYKKSAVLAVCVVMLLSGLVALLADFSSAEDEEPSVEKYTGEGADYVYMDVIYKITSDEETQEEVAVYKLVDDHAKDITVAASFSYGEGDDEVTYTVTGILKDAFKGEASKLTSLLLPTTLTGIESGALTGMESFDFKIPAVLKDGKVSSPCYDKTVAVKEYFPDYAQFEGKFLKEADGVDVSFYINITSAAELNATNIGDFEDGFYTETFYDGVLNQIVGCQYERDYFECAGWSFVEGDPVDGDDIAFDDGAAIELSDLDGETDLYAAWEETSPYEDYPEWMMWGTVAIIIFLAVVGIVMLFIRSRQAKA